MSATYIIVAMKVSELGEFGLIEALAGVVSWQNAAPELLVGIGDDAAAWPGDEVAVLATTDTLVQGVHFSSLASTPLPFAATWKELGWKALAISLSDIAAMGGVPQYVLAALSLPGDTEVDDAVELYRGMAELARQFEVTVAGGNVSSAPVVVITTTVVGRAEGDRLLLRSGAKAGDLIAVTGCLGSSAGGCRMLSQRLRFEAETTAMIRKAHLQPWPRVAEGRLLLEHGVRAAIDISDGLISDLTHVCKASKTAARVDVNRVPLHPLLQVAFREEALGLALAGGEDYELLFAAAPQVMEEVRQGASCPITVIGEMLEGEPGQVNLVDKDGRPIPWEGKGWEHFRS